MVQVSASELRNIVKSREIIYKQGKKEIAFFIYPFKITEKQGFVEQAVEKFCNRNKIHLYKAAARALSRNTFSHIIASSLFCDIGIVVMSKNPNENIAYEMGLMIALGKPIFVLKDFSIERPKPFDYRAILHISYKNEAELKRGLQKQYEEYQRGNFPYKVIRNKVLKKLIKVDSSPLEKALDSLGISSKGTKSKNLEELFNQWDRKPIKTLKAFTKINLFAMCNMAKLNVNKSDTAERMARKLNRKIYEELAEIKAERYYPEDYTKVVDKLLEDTIKGLRKS
ncbi:MAG: hypothetical protein ACTSQE_04770 [Candidatus Heimdallarchaeaceae archaeon]